MSRHRYCFVLITALLAFSGIAPHALACSYPLGSASYPSLQNDDFLDWGQLLEDARGPDAGCAIAARDRLVEKLSLTPDSYWQQFLSGQFVMMVMASGLALGGRGLMTTQLDFELHCVARNYRYVQDASCGWIRNGQANWYAGNSCMDDHAIAASGYAWMAAWLRRSGRDWYAARYNAVDQIHQSFNPSESICVWDPSQPFHSLTGPCNGCYCEPPPTRENPSPGVCHNGIQSLGTNNVQLLSLNDGYQTPAYGIGLMANVAAAFLGLEIANAAVAYSEISDDERRIAQFLWTEGQQKSLGDGSEFVTACYKINLGNCNPNDIRPLFQPGYACWDPCKVASNGQRYRPRFYPLDVFYERYGFPKGASGYMFTTAGFVSADFNSTEFFHVGRRETYLTLANTWFNSAPALNAGNRYRLALRAPNGWPYWYMNATGGGGPGSVVHATSQVPTQADTQFTIVDVNGGTLNDGDSVWIKMYYNGYWLAAENGGGGRIIADSTSPVRFEYFTIRKLGGLFFNGPIAHGDPFALQALSGHYLRIDGGGGGTITANATSAGPFETFTFEKVDDLCSRGPAVGR